MRKRSELFFNLILVPLDAGAVLASFILAYIIRVDYFANPTVYQIPGREYAFALLALLPFTVLFFALAGLYSYESTRSRWREYGQVVVAVAADTMFLIIADFFSTKPLFPSKSVVIFGFLLSVFSVIFMRFIVNFFQRSLFRFNIGVRQVVIIGSGQAADNITYYLQRNTGFSLIRAIPQTSQTLDQLQKLIKRKHIDEIYVVDSVASERSQIEYLNFAHENHIVYKYVPTLAGIYHTRKETSLVDDYPLLEIVRTPLDGWWRIYKALFDYLGALIGLVLLSPLFLIVGIIIKFTDGGKIFYQHRRIGRYGQPVHVWKFRSMYEKYSTGKGFSGKTDAQILEELGDKKLVQEFRKDQKLKNDPRVTPIGRFLRKSSLDELPQLINVMRGELSLIGPRPVTEDELARYKENRPTFLLIKPGLTGLWQVSGRNDVSYDERIKLDVYYVENWSALMDLRILWRTIGVLLRRKGY